MNAVRPLQVSSRLNTSCVSFFNMLMYLFLLQVQLKCTHTHAAVCNLKMRCPKLCFNLLVGSLNTTSVN